MSDQLHEHQFLLLLLDLGKGVSGGSEEHESVGKIQRKFDITIENKHEILFEITVENKYEILYTFQEAVVLEPYEQKASTYGSDVVRDDTNE